MDYPTRTRTGGAVLDRLVLTGWGAVTSYVTSLFTWTDGGRLWWVFTQSSGDLSFYRRKTAGSGDKVCSGTVSSGLVTLSQANTSGISGTAELTTGDYSGALVQPTADSTGDVILSWCDENDLIDAAKGVPNVLDSNSKWFGQLARFESLFLHHMRDYGNYVQQRLAGRVNNDFNGRPGLCDIMEPRELAKSYANYIVSEVMEGRQGTDLAKIEATKIKRARAFDLLDSLELAVDTGASRKLEAKIDFSSGVLVRG